MAKRRKATGRKRVYRGLVWVGCVLTTVIIGIVLTRIEEKTNMAYFQETVSETLRGLTYPVVFEDHNTFQLTAASYTRPMVSFTLALKGDDVTFLQQEMDHFVDQATAYVCLGGDYNRLPVTVRVMSATLTADYSLERLCVEGSEEE